jgi:hypothetical protein
MKLPRHVQPEILDVLDGDDVDARRSRRDLRRINRAMATLAVVLPALDRVAAPARPRTLLELGAGDGSLMLRVARRRASDWPALNVVLLDRQPLVPPESLREMRGLGWTPEVATADVFDWLESAHAEPWDIVFANLFVHHFEGRRLAALLAGIAARARAFVCCEPRRGAVALLGSHLVRLIGANAVTRHDAIASVHAGFRGAELSGLWPGPDHWRVREHSAGLFCHCFVATRIGN